MTDGERARERRSNRTGLAAAAATAFGLAAAGCAATAGGEGGNGLAALLDADRAFAAQSRAEGVASAFAAFVSDDTVLLPTGAEPVIGADAVARHLAGSPEGVTLDWTPVDGRVATAGDVGVTWGRYSLSAPVSDGASEELVGSYVTVWRREPDGGWRAAIQIGNK